MFNNLVCFCILIVILYLLYYYYFNTCGCNTSSEEFKNFNLNKDKPMNYNMEKIICSKNCCSTQWPTTVQINDSNINIDDYLPTNLNCNYGCVCKKKNI